MRYFFLIFYLLSILGCFAETKWNRMHLTNPTELESILQNYDSISAVWYYHPERDPDEELTTDYEIHSFQFDGKDYLYVTGNMRFIPLWRVKDEITGELNVSPALLGYCDKSPYFRIVIYSHTKRITKRFRKLLKTIDYIKDKAEICKMEPDCVVYDPLQAMYELHHDGTFSLIEYGNTLKFWKGKKYFK